MKLRNKKTGEIVEVESLYLTQTQELYLNYINEENKQKVYITDKIASFNLDWEDYEEPKEYWRITDLGELKSIRLDQHHQNIKKCKEIGNYFETKEEAEKAVEKLKAWKRLKYKGFKFDLWDYDGGNYQEKIKTGRILFRIKDYEENDKDLDLLFGGEE